MVNIRHIKAEVSRGVFTRWERVKRKMTKMDNTEHTNDMVIARLLLFWEENHD